MLVIPKSFPVSSRFGELELPESPAASHPATGTDPQLNNAPSLVSSSSVATPALVSSPPVVTPSPVSLSVASDFTNVTISSAHIIGDFERSSGKTA
jgi:hypothetical protein